MECLDKPEWSILTDQSVSTDLDFMYLLVVSKNPIYQLWRVRHEWVVVVVHLDYSVSSGPFLRFPMSFEFLVEMFDRL